MELNRFFDFLGEVLQKANVRACFGEPETIGQKTVISVARVRYGLGLGFGQAEKPSEGRKAEDSDASGGGGGGGGAATPIAVVEVAEDSTRVVPIVDLTKLALASMLMVTWNLFWIIRVIRALKDRKAAR